MASSEFTKKKPMWAVGKQFVFPTAFEGENAKKERKKEGEQKEGDVKSSWSRYGAGFLPLPTGAQAFLASCSGKCHHF